MSDTKSPFVHLHVHSMYSLLDAMGDVTEIIDAAKQLGYDAIALTDHAGLYGAIEFYEAAHKAGLKPIIGVEAYIALNSLHDRRPRIDDKTHHLTLLAETNEGYQNVLTLVSTSFLEGFYYVPRMDKELLRQHAKGLIALSGCLKSEISKSCLQDAYKAEKIIREYQEIFGTENFFIELIHHPESSTQNNINGALIELAKKTGAPLVATKDVHYILPTDSEAQDALHCIHDGRMLAETNRFSIHGIDHSLVAPKDMINAFAHVPDAILNTRKIADRCNVTLELGKNLLPIFDVPTGYTTDTYLRELCEKGLKERYPALQKEAVERLDFELETIQRMGFASYFLIVQDYVNWAKEHGVIVGPGRGSAAGSIVAYSLRITNLDPLRYGLLFERFLNPDRLSMPDIDMDFDDVKRKDVIEYVSNTYGRDHVAGIITFGTMAARAAVRDVGRVLGMTFQEVDRVAKVIPPPVQGKHIPLATSIKEAPELRALYETEPQMKQLLDLAIKLEGTARHASQHACGIVIAPKPLSQCAPLQKAQGGDVDQVIQYSLHSSEVSGLLKMDFLGLSNLTIIRECLEIVEAVYGVKTNIDTIPLNDIETYQLLGAGKTTGVFQLESDGMKRYIKELKPTEIEDIIAMVALYRPGPMQFIDSFIARKHGKEKIEYMHPLLESALKNTYGIPVYQEQIMQVSKDMAGFTGGEADTLRKAMGKKIAKLMNEMRLKFVEGSIKKGVAKEIAEHIFIQFEEFAAYGFNKSHAACYALIAYQTAFLKAHWPECFMAALMNADSDNLDRITIDVDEARHMGMQVLPPDINESFARFSVVKGAKIRTIRFGLQAIKGLGQDVVDYIIRVRKEGGEFKSIQDILHRVEGRAINRKSMEALIKSGALDRFGDRSTFLYNIEYILEYHKNAERETHSGQFNLFASSVSDASPFKLQHAPLASSFDLLRWEKELLGLYISDHPFRSYKAKLEKKIIDIQDIRIHGKEKQVSIGGVITEAKKILTKNNEPMVFAKVEDLSGKCEVVVFPKVYRDASPDVWVADAIIYVRGKPQQKDGEWKILADTAFALTPMNIDEVVGEGKDIHSSESVSETGVCVHVRASLSETVILHLRKIFDENSGPHPVIFVIDDVDGQRKIRSSAKISFSEDIVKKIEAIIGTGTVKIM